VSGVFYSPEEIDYDGEKSKEGMCSLGRWKGLKVHIIDDAMLFSMLNRSLSGAHA